MAKGQRAAVPAFRPQRRRGGVEPRDRTARRTTVEVNGFPCRVWRKGSGPKLGFLAGLGGLPRWMPFLDALAETRTVIVPSLPGFPGGDAATPCSTRISTGCWRCASSSTRRASTAPISSAARSAARSPPRWRRSGRPRSRRLALIAPFGLFDESEPADRSVGAARGRRCRPDVRRPARSGTR